MLTSILQILMWQGLGWDQNLSHWSCRAIIDGVWRNSAQNGCKFIVPSICFILFPILAVTGSSLWKLIFLNLSPLASVRARFNWMSVKIYGSNAIFRRVLSSWRGCVCRKVGYAKFWMTLTWLKQRFRIIVPTQPHYSPVLPHIVLAHPHYSPCPPKFMPFSLTSSICSRDICL